MGKPVLVSILFSAVIKVKEGYDLRELIFKETDWMGEPRSPNGCVINMTPKDIRITDRKRNNLPAKILISEMLDGTAEDVLATSQAVLKKRGRKPKTKTPLL